MLLLAGAAACGRLESSKPGGAGQEATARSARVVDSILPIDEELRRFRTTVAAKPAGLAGGAGSRAGLVRAFVRAVERADTLGLGRLLLDRAEFAYLYYPQTPFTRPPYRQKPGLVWFQMSHASNQGLARVLARHGGRPLGYAGFSCAAAPVREGPNWIWRRCTLRIRAEGGMVERQLFGGILERDGRYKFLTYATDY